MILKIAFVLAVMAAGILLYGYWHAATHATLHVWLQDGTEGNWHQPVLEAELSFMDASGRPVAKARSEAPLGVVYLSEPAAVACHEFERSAAFSAEARERWHRCFENQSRWLSRQVPAIASVRVATGPCRLQVPVTLAAYTDWWLWWVPSPHIGGTPYTNYSIRVVVDREQCG
jgi:hypothetical protein